MPNLFVIVSLLVVAGCDQHGAPVHFVVPDGFRGPFYLIKDSLQGVFINATGDQYTVEIPQAGSLKLHDFGLFDSWHQETASFAGGARIPTESESGGTGELGTNVFGLRGGGTSWVNDGPETVTYFIGTQKDFDDWANTRRPNKHLQPTRR
jgi:hypothetical protein